MKIIEALKKDEIIVCASDTVYGIGCRLFDLKSKEKIFKLKKRPNHQELPIICADLAMVKTISILTPLQEKIIDHFSPGAVTFIVKAQEGLNLPATIAVRIPDCNDLLEILKTIKQPLWFTSANVHHEETSSDIEQIKALFKDQVGAYQEGKITNNISSTIFDLLNNKVLREGAVCGLEIIKYMEELK